MEDELQMLPHYKMCLHVGGSHFQKVYQY